MVFGQILILKVQEHQTLPNNLVHVNQFKYSHMNCPINKESINYIILFVDLSHDLYMHSIIKLSQVASWMFPFSIELNFS